MRFKTLSTFSAFCNAIQWTVHENMDFHHKISSFSTLDDAKTACADMSECAGVTKIGTAYELRKGPDLLETDPKYQPTTTYAKRHIEWSDGHAGKYLPSSFGSSAFSVLEEAKKKCIELVVQGDECGGITQSSNGDLTLRKGSEFITSPSGEISYIWYWTQEDFQIDITFEK